MFYTVHYETFLVSSYTPAKMNIFRGILELACLSVCSYIFVSVCVQNTRFCKSTGEGIKSHLVMALVIALLKSMIKHFRSFISQS